MSYFSYSRNLPQWVGQLPDSWRSDWIKWSVDLSTKRPNEDQQAQLPYISNEDIESWTGTLLREDFKPSDSDSRLFRRGDVLFNKLRPYLAKVYQATFDGVSSGELLCLQPGSNVESRFLFYVLVSKGFINTIDSETFGAKMPRADWETVGHQPLPLPPLETQRRIAAFLDEKTARIDGLIAKKRELLERLAEKRQALITQAVTKGLNPHAPMKPSGIDWLGDIPAHWEVVSVNRLISMKSGDMISSKDIEVEGSFPVFGGNGFRGFTSTFNAPAHTVLVGRQGAYCGNIQITTGRTFVTEHALRCFPKMNINHLWLAAILETMQLGDKSVSAAQPGLSVDRLNSLRTVYANIEEQTAIAEKIRQSLEQQDETLNQIQKSIDLLTEYRSALITAAVTGQIDLPALDEQGQTSVKGGSV